MRIISYHRRWFKILARHPLHCLSFSCLKNRNRWYIVWWLVSMSLGYTKRIKVEIILVHHFLCLDAWIHPLKVDNTSLFLLVFKVCVELCHIRPLKGNNLSDFFADHLKGHAQILFDMDYGQCTTSWCKDSRWDVIALSKKMDPLRTNGSSCCLVAILHSRLSAMLVWLKLNRE